MGYYWCGIPQMLSTACGTTVIPIHCVVTAPVICLFNSPAMCSCIVHMSGYMLCVSCAAVGSEVVTGGTTELHDVPILGLYQTPKDGS